MSDPAAIDEASVPRLRRGVRLRLDPRRATVAEPGTLATLVMGLGGLGGLGIMRRRRTF